MIPGSLSVTGQGFKADVNVTSPRNCGKFNDTPCEENWLSPTETENSELLAENSFDGEAVVPRSTGASIQDLDEGFASVAIEAQENAWDDRPSLR